MKINKLSFITPHKKISNKKIVLEKSYSQEFKLLDGVTISLSSSIGNRETQQDCIAITQNKDYTLLLVSDGIGGMQDGETASYTTAKIIKKWLESEDEDALKKITAKTLEDALNALMYLISTDIPELSGATLNMSIIGPKETLIANVGDSRTYTIKDGEITLITQDDSVVFNRYNPQTKSERDRLRFHKDNNVITNSITKGTFPTINVTTIQNEKYDIMCHVTDGITDFLTENLILSYSQNQNPANVLVNKSTTGMSIYNYDNHPKYKKIINPGEDNATAIVYTKKRIKNI